jgi:pimeloyl-ACP methyl ester carboxylesterase
VTERLIVSEVSYDRRGAGTPVVLVHGLGSRWQVFEPILDLVADGGHEVISVDLPGFGASPSVPGVTPGPRGYAEWLAGWLEEQGIERPHVVGNSMGGGVALELGRAGVASGVTAFSPIGFYGPLGRRWVQTLLTLLRVGSTLLQPVLARAVTFRAARVAVFGVFFGRPGDVDPEALRDDVAGLVGATSFAEARNSFAGYVLSQGDDRGALNDIAVTVAWGTRDVVLTHRPQSARARAALPNARHVDLPGCGHLPFSDDPEACARIVLEGTREESR